MGAYEELCDLDWPEEFIVEYRDGQRERLLRGDGVCVTPPYDDPDGIGSFDGYLPKKSPATRSQHLRYVRFSEVRALFDVKGVQIWPQT